ncbi:hypothetical protein AHF37_12633 [Paragonimus kellicotti]|nr:hypothetical protein AHF37_12633 [Paragonimus kellicotti]
MPWFMIRGELHGLRPDISLFRYQISTPLSTESTGYPVKFSMDTVKDLQLLNATLEDITLNNTMVIDQFLHYMYTDELFETYRMEFSWNLHQQYPGNAHDQ